MIVTIYKAATGQIVRTDKYPDGRDDVVALNMGADEGFVHGNYPPEEYVIDPETRHPISLPMRPAPVYTMDMLRIERDRRLATCDWTQLLDAPLTEPQRVAWRDYRQSLRDLPETTADPASPIWPAQPD